ncbi:MAG: hypothetical protein P8013_15125, partial [Candidatus Sulfobium sp.]
TGRGLDAKGDMTKWLFDHILLGEITAFSYLGGDKPAIFRGLKAHKRHFLFHGDAEGAER